MSEFPTFEQAMQQMQGMLEKLPEMAPPMQMPPQQRADRATAVMVQNLDARFGTYLESCIHCGHCAEACHFFQVTGDPKYTPVHKLDLLRRTYRRESGPFRWLYRLFSQPITAEELADWKELAFDSCTMCGRCTLICPMGIDIAAMVHVVRESISAAGLAPPEIRAVEAEQATQDTVFGASPEKLKEVIGMLEQQAGIEIPLDREQAEMLVLTSGLDIMMNPRGLLATAKVLNHLGADWTLRSDGYESINFGAQVCDKEIHKDIARRRIDTAKKIGAKTLLLCECGHTYPALRWAEGIYQEPLPFEVIYISDYLGKQVQAGRLKLRRDGRSVTFHDPCKTGRVGGIFDQPRAVLEAMGDEVCETPDHKMTNFCCGGGGGGFLLNNLPLRSKVYQMKMQQFDATGADTVVTACGSCRLNFATAKMMLESERPIESLVELAADHLPDDEGWRRPG